MQHSPEVSQPSSLSQTHLSVVLRWLAYVPDSFSRPSLQWRHTLTPAMLTPRPKKERVSCASHRSLSWCRLTRSRQSSVFLRRYVKHQGWSVRVYLLPVWGLHGNPLWRRHLLSVSRSQHESIRGRKGERETETWRKGTLYFPYTPRLLYCCRKLVSIFTNIDYCLLEELYWPMLWNADLCT